MRKPNKGIVSTVKSNEAQVQIARKALQDAVIRSPISGIVAKKMVNVGEKVGPDSLMFSIVDLGNMEIEAPAPAMEIPSVKAGQAARFLVDGFGERPSKGRWSASTRSPSRARARSRCTSRLPTTTGAERRHVRQGIAGPRQVGVSAGGPAGADSRRDRQRCRFDGAHRLPVLACMAQHHHHRAHLAHRIH